MPTDLVPPSPRPIVVTYQGAPGSFSEQASLKFFDRYHFQEPKFVPSATFAEAFSALASGTVNRAVIPIENSLAGTIHENLDNFLRHPQLTIVGEIDLPIRHCLMALPGTTLSDITMVKSHPMAIAQCKNFLNSHSLPSQVEYDTAGYAQLIKKEQLRGIAAIAGSRAAKIYELELVAEAIQDESVNYTRFLIIGNQKNEPDSSLNYYYRSMISSNPDSQLPQKPQQGKTSIAFSLINSPGILCRALSVFAVSNIDLMKIESRHIHTVRKTLGGEADEDINAKRWGYVFYVDISRHIDDEALKAALNHLQQITSFYRLLGSYPADESPASLS